MEKDDIEKKKLYISQGTINKDNNENDIKVTSSIYRIKNKENLDINKNEENNENVSVKKIYNSDDKKINLNDKNSEITKYLNYNPQHNSRQNSKESKNKISQNNRYQYFENEYENEKDDEIFSERNDANEKPNILNYKKIEQFAEKPDNENKQFEKKYPSNENQEIMLRNSNNKLELSYLQEENPQSNEEMKSSQNGKKKEDFSKYYLPSQKYVKKHKIFLVLFSIGIALSSVSSIFCIFLQFYGNQDVYILLCSISLILIILYILAIIFSIQDRKKIISIIQKREDPEKILNSKTRKYLLLIIYFLIISINYFYVVMLVDTCFINNIKLSIRGKGYDIRLYY